MLHFSPTPSKLLFMKATPRPYHHGHLREALLRAAEKALEKGGVQSSTDGKFKGLSLDRLTGEIIERLFLGFQPRP